MRRLVINNPHNKVMRDSWNTKQRISPWRFIRVGAGQIWYEEENIVHFC